MNLAYHGKATWIVVAGFLSGRITGTDKTTVSAGCQSQLGGCLLSSGVQIYRLFVYLRCAMVEDPVALASTWVIKLSIQVVPEHTDT